MATNSGLRIFRSLVEVRPNDYEIARRISRILDLGIEKKDFIRMETTERFTEVDDDPVLGFIIYLKNNRKIEITILDDTFFIAKEFGDEYKFVKRYYYDVKTPISEFFGIDNGECFLNIKDEYPVHTITVENEEKGYSRGCVENTYVDEDGNVSVNLTTFVEDYVSDNINHHNTVFYFSNKADMYHFSFSDKFKKYSYLAGASLNIPRYKLSANELTPDEHKVFDHIGILEGTKRNYPNIYLNITYLNGIEINRVSLNFIKFKSSLGFELDEDGERTTYNFPGTRSINITLKDLNTIKEKVLELIGDKPFINIITNYLDELSLRLSRRMACDDMGNLSYNGDIFDYYLNQGRDMNDLPAIDIEHRAFEIYTRKNNLNKLLTGMKSPEVEIKSETPVLEKK